MGRRGRRFDQEQPGGSASCALCVYGALCAPAPPWKPGIFADSPNDEDFPGTLLAPGTEFRSEKAFRFRASPGWGGACNSVPFIKQITETNQRGPQQLKGTDAKTWLVAPRRGTVKIETGPAISGWGKPILAGCATGYGTAPVQTRLAVLPQDAAIVGVGNIGPQDVGEWVSAGARGVGLGLEIYRPGDTPAAVFEKAKVVVNALHQEKE